MVPNLSVLVSRKEVTGNLPGDEQDDDENQAIVWSACARARTHTD